MKRLICIMCLGMLCLVLVACGADPAPPPQGGSADQRLAGREGLEHSKQIEESNLPGKLEIGLAIGSVIAMIGVLKYV